jgi:hypothetical protein
MRMMTKLFALVLIILSSSLAPTLVVHASLASTDWPMLGHDLAHTGRSPFLGSQGNTQKWNYLAEGPIDSSPAIGTAGTIYFGSSETAASEGTLYALNPDGTLKWKYTTGNFVTSSPAISSDGTVYVGSYDYNLYAINGPLIGWDLTNSGRITLVAGSGSNTINARSVGGTSQTVSLSCNGLPSGASCTFNPSSGSPTFASTLTISTLSSVFPGAYTITVTGTSGKAAATTRVSLTIPGSVGGSIVPIDKWTLLAPYLALLTVTLGAGLASMMYFRKAKSRRHGR